MSEAASERSPRNREYRTNGRPTMEVIASRSAMTRNTCWTTVIVTRFRSPPNCDYTPHSAHHMARIGELMSGGVAVTSVGAARWKCSPPVSHVSTVNWRPIYGKKIFHPPVFTYSTSHHQPHLHGCRSKSETRYGRRRRICVPGHSRCARASGTSRSHHCSAPRNI